MSEPGGDPASIPLLFSDPVTEFYLAKVDRAAIRERLKMSLDERLDLVRREQIEETGSSRVREDVAEAPSASSCDLPSKFAGFPTYTPDPDPALIPMLFPDPVIEVYMKDVDRGLIREQLKKTPPERLESLIAMAEYAEELHRAGEELRRRQMEV